jgi:hypothetical protein
MRTDTGGGLTGYPHPCSPHVICVFGNDRTILPGLEGSLIIRSHEGHDQHAQPVVVNAGLGSVARIDSRQIVFSRNAGGATVGNVSDVVVGL